MKNYKFVSRQYSEKEIYEYVQNILDEPFVISQYAIKIYGRSLLPTDTISNLRIVIKSIVKLSDESNQLIVNYLYEQSHVTLQHYLRDNPDLIGVDLDAIRLLML